jgi:hypothetical protein
MEAQPAASISGAGLDTAERTISVTVLDGADNRPISGALILTADYGVSGRALTNRLRFVTDEKGVVPVKVPPLHQQAQNFALSVQHSNYAERAVTWILDSGRIRERLPSSHTFRLERGITIGGYVRDSRDQPLPGVKVIPSGNTGANVPQGSGLKTWEQSSASPLNGNGSVTDKNGSWIFEHLPSDFIHIRLEVFRPGGARTTFATAFERQFSGMPATEIQRDALRDTNAVLKLEDGFAVRGLIADTNGKPLNGVRLKERSGQGYYSGPYVFTNQADGRFELSHREARQFVLTAEAEGLASKSVVVSPAADMAEVRMVLPPAQPMRLRVLGEGDTPVVGAELRAIEWRTPGQVIDWTGETDAQGRVVWSNAPLENVTFWITTTNYPVRSAKLHGGATETVIRLRESKDQGVEVVIRAIEDPGGKSVGKFEVRKQFYSHEGYADWGRGGDDGVFRVRLRPGDFPNGFMSTYRPMVIAEGYAPWTTDFLYVDEGDQELTAKLHKAPVPAGVVRQPDGQPAADARVHLNTTESSLFANRPGEFSAYRGVEIRQTDQDGSFRFPSALESHRLVISHSSGFASLTVEELQRSGKVTLQAWGQVDGTLRAGGKTLAKERIAIRSPISWAALESHHLVFNANTDAEGHFTFTNLPPGDYVLYRTPHLISGIQTTESHRHVFDVRPGETKKIDYGFNGRTLTGHVDADGTVDWQNDPHVLVVKLPPAPPEPGYQAFVDPKDYQKARKEYGRSPAVLEYERKRQQFQLVFDKNGDFRTDDVPPGTYELRVRATKPPANRNMGRWGREEELGSLTREVTIPPGAPGEEYDLGTFELPFKVPVVASGAPISFAAVTLDGKPFDPASLRGKPVVMIFWAKWAPQSGAQLADMRAAFEGIGPEGRAAFVTVNLDESAEDARVAMADLKRGWTHVRLEGPARFTVTEQLTIDTLPTTLLLGVDGRVNARDVGGKRLRPAIDRLVRQTAKN